MSPNPSRLRDPARVQQARGANEAVAVAVAMAVSDFGDGAGVRVAGVDGAGVALSCLGVKVRSGWGWGLPPEARLQQLLLMHPSPTKTSAKCSCQPHPRIACPHLSPIHDARSVRGTDSVPSWRLLRPVAVKVHSIPCVCALSYFMSSNNPISRS